MPLSLRVLHLTSPSSSLVLSFPICTMGILGSILIRPSFRSVTPDYSVLCPFVVFPQDSDVVSLQPALDADRSFEFCRCLVLFSSKVLYRFHLLASGTITSFLYSLNVSSSTALTTAVFQPESSRGLQCGSLHIPVLFHSHSSLQPWG